MGPQDAMPSDSLPRSPPRHGLIPDFCRLPMVLGVVLTAELLAIVLALASGGPLARFWEQLGPLSLYTQTITLASAALLCLARPWLARRGDRDAALLAWLSIQGVAALTGLAAAALVPPPLRTELFPPGGTGDLLVRTLGISAIGAALLIRYLTLHALWRRQIEAEAEARFQKLQARIRPHFLFNSMNTIAHLTRTDPRLAEEMVEDLADLFRASLADEDQASTLADELELAHRFLNIERQRLGERLNVQWDIEGLPGSAPLPPLILQPLVENAIYHGIEPARRPGLIRIAGHYRNGQVRLTIRNTLPAEGEAGRHTSGNRMALRNIRQRLSSLFSGAAQVIETRSEGAYQISLIFPYPWRARP
ncbi:hypothetical protein CKO22_07360 [Thiococcus pfennigii]|nr:hypothetical protein [Thiococcus pfennigii]